MVKRYLTLLAPKYLQVAFVSLSCWPYSEDYTRQAYYVTLFQPSLSRLFWPNPRLWYWHIEWILIQTKGYERASYDLRHQETRHALVIASCGRAILSVDALIPVHQAQVAESLEEPLRIEQNEQAYRELFHKNPITLRHIAKQSWLLP